MDFIKVYNQLISKRIKNPAESEYTEKHHILPRSLGGSDEPINIVELTAREHFICHALLAEAYPKESFKWYKMNHAFMMMRATGNRDRYINNRLYEKKRKDFSKVMSLSQSGEKNSSYGTTWIFHEKLEKSIKVLKDESTSFLTTGWKQGRVMNFDLYSRKQAALTEFIKENQRDVLKAVELDIEKEKKLIARKLRRSHETKDHVFIKTGYKLNKRRRDQCTNLFKLDIYNQEDVDTLYSKLYEEYVILDFSTVQLAKMYNSTDPTIRKLLIDIGIGTKKRNGKWK
jgi:hypothetical protein